MATKTTQELSIKKLEDQLKFMTEQMRWERDRRAELEEEVGQLKDEIRHLRWNYRL